MINRITTLKLNSQGATALITVIVIAVSVLIMALSASVLGLGELEMGYTSQKGGETFFATDGCVEEGLRRLKLDINYTGSSLNLLNGSCIITVTGGGGSRTVIASSTVGEYNRSIQADITISGNNITVNNWQEF